MSGQTSFICGVIYKDFSIGIIMFYIELHNRKIVLDTANNNNFSKKWGYSQLLRRYSYIHSQYAALEHRAGAPVII